MRQLKIQKSPRAEDENPQPLICGSDNAIKRIARKHQSNYRFERLHCSHDHNHRYGKYGAYLKWDDALKGKNFYHPFWNKIEKAIKKRYPESEPWQLAPIYANMLRSEHIPFNFFVPMQDDLNAAAKVFDEMIGGNQVAKIIDIKIEYAPEKQYTLNDGTSFDTFVLYRHKDGQLGGIGIEIKYTEGGYQLKHDSKEWRDIVLGENKNYINVTRNCMYYTDSIVNTPLPQSPLVKNDYRQIWRNHILGASMINNANIEYDLKHFNSVTIYPSFNTHFEKVIPQYEKMLSEYGKKTFCGITYENFFNILASYYDSTDFIYWQIYLHLRYIPTKTNKQIQ